MRDKEFDEINVIPLVDIMLVLLTIVLTTATFIATGQIAVNLPEVKNMEANAQSPLKITITKDEILYINERKIVEEAIGDILKTFDNEQAVIIKADEDIPLRKFAFVMDVLKGNGFKKVSMEVRKR
jgi:biopolymer transport protein ExbD